MLMLVVELVLVGGRSGIFRAGCKVFRRNLRKAWMKSRIESGLLALKSPGVPEDALSGLETGTGELDGKLKLDLNGMQARWVLTVTNSLRDKNPFGN